MTGEKIDPEYEPTPDETHETGFRDATIRRLAELRTSTKSLGRQVEKLTASIEGNGDLGLKYRVDRMESWIKPRSRIEWMVIGAAVTAAVAWLIKEIFVAK